MNFPKVPEEQRPTLSEWIWSQKALFPEFSWFFFSVYEQMVFLLIRCQIFLITRNATYWEPTMCWVLYLVLEFSMFFSWEFCFNLGVKMQEKKWYPLLWKSQTLKSAYTLLFTVSTFETAVDVQMKVAVWSGKCGSIHLWRLCVSPALWPTEKEIVVHSIKYCQYD